MIRYDDDLPLPPDNPEFEMFDDTFQDTVDQRFQAGIALGRYHAGRVVGQIRTDRSARIARDDQALIVRREVLERARRRVR